MDKKKIEVKRGQSVLRTQNAKLRDYKSVKGLIFNLLFHLHSTIKTNKPVLTKISQRGISCVSVPSLRLKFNFRPTLIPVDV